MAGSCPVLNGMVGRTMSTRRCKDGCNRRNTIWWPRRVIEYGKRYGEFAHG
ncbi:MAG: hypothetical protein R2867_27450 [Caldilineaceae bacterium]